MWRTSVGLGLVVVGSLTILVGTNALYFWEIKTRQAGRHIGSPPGPAAWRTRLLPSLYRALATAFGLALVGAGAWIGVAAPPWVMAAPLVLFVVLLVYIALLRKG